MTGRWHNTVHIKKLNQLGFDHVLLPVLAVVTVAVIGTATVVLSHAATAQPLVVFKLNGNNSCLEVTSLATCAANARETDYYRPVAGAKNFLLKDQAGYCLQNGSNTYQSKPANQGGHNYIPTLTTCNSSKTNQQWNWTGPGRHELSSVVTGNKGCLNAAGMSSKLGTRVIVYSCNGGWNENWYIAYLVTAPKKP